VGWNPDDEDCDIDAGSSKIISMMKNHLNFRKLTLSKLYPTSFQVSARTRMKRRVLYLHLPDQPPVIDNDRDPIDDDLHQ
jgi:hypothetical protein